jgi:ATP-dependent RNA helicase DeaD
MSQGARDGVMIAFKDGRERLLVATDVAARGLDIAGVSHIINYDVPNSPDVYVHRIGRTGRAGEKGRAITFITPKQRSDLAAIEEHASTTIPEWGSAEDTPVVSPVPVPVAEPEPEADAAAEPAKAEDEVKAQPDPEPAETPDEQPESGPKARRARRQAAGNGRDPGDKAEAEPREPRRRRHSKPRRDDVEGDQAKIFLGAGRKQGFRPADVVGAIVDHSHLDGEDVRNVRVLERFSFLEVPAERAGEVVDKVSGNEVRGVKLRLEVAKR